MKVILKQDIDRLGQRGEIVEVAAGYARNFLIPKKFALEVTKPNLRVYEEERKQQEISATKERRESEVLAKSLENVSCTAVVSVGEDDRVFGSVTSQMIAELLKEKGYDVDRRKVMLDEPIRALGVYGIPIKLHAEVETQVKVWVVKE